MKEVIKCVFEEAWFTSEPDKKYYRCAISNIEIPEQTELIFFGKHQKGKTDDDVDHISIRNCKLSKIPKGLLKTFPNIKHLSIRHTNLKEVSRDDLAEYKNLEKIVFTSNKIKFLPGDLFEGFENLEWIGFWRNKISIIEPNILDGLNKLTLVDFKDNPNYTKCFSINQNHEPNATLEEVKSELKKSFEVHAKKEEMQYSTKQGQPCFFDTFGFNHEPKKYYGCVIKNLKISKNLELNGKHQLGKSNKDVETVRIKKSTLRRIPKELVHIFPNMKNLEIINTTMNVITRDDMAEFKNLKKIICNNNQIQFLPGDLFQGFKNLEWISFSENQISIIEPNILDGLDKLAFVNFKDNPNYTKCYFVNHNSEPYASLEDVKAELKQNFGLKAKIKLIELKVLVNILIHIQSIQQLNVFNRFSRLFN